MLIKTPTFSMQLEEYRAWNAEEIEVPPLIFRPCGNLDIFLSEQGRGVALEAYTTHLVSKFKGEEVRQFDLMRKKIIARDFFDRKTLPDQYLGDMQILLIGARQQVSDAVRHTIFWSAVTVSKQLRLGLKTHFRAWWKWWETQDTFIDDEAKTNRKRSSLVLRAAKRKAKVGT